MTDLFPRPILTRFRLSNPDRQGVEAILIHTYDRTEAGRGADDELTFRGMALELFTLHPQSSRVALFVIGEMPVMLVELAHRWYDVRLNLVILSKLPEAA
jgi:hypothetical protein